MKEDIKNKLKKAVGRECSIIHFSNLKNKLGINPRTNFKTPAGVYGYILDKDSFECLKRPYEIIRREKDKEECGFSDFATNRKYIYIAEYKKSKRVIHINKNGESPYIEENFINIMSSLANLYDRKIELFVKDEKILNALFTASFIFQEKSKTNTKTGGFWYATRRLSRNSAAWGRMLLELGIGAVFDHGSGTIHPAEPKQAVILETNKIEVLLFQENPFSWSEKMMSDAFRILKFFDKKIGFKLINNKKDNLVDHRFDPSDIQGDFNSGEFRFYMANESPYFCLVTCIKVIDHSCEYVHALFDMNYEKTYIFTRECSLGYEMGSFHPSVFDIYNSKFTHKKETTLIPTFYLSKLNVKVMGEYEFIPESIGEITDLCSEFLYELKNNVALKDNDLLFINKLKRNKIANIEEVRITKDKGIVWHQSFPMVVFGEHLKLDVFIRTERLGIGLVRCVIESDIGKYRIFPSWIFVNENDGDTMKKIKGISENIAKTVKEVADNSRINLVALAKKLGPYIKEVVEKEWSNFVLIDMNDSY